MSQTQQMDVLYLQPTGHILAIFTRNAEPAQVETDASSFVGSGLHVRGWASGQDLVIPSNLIGFFRTTRQWQQIFHPYTQYVTGLPNSPALNAFGAATPSVSYAALTLTITLASALGANANILALVLDTAGGNPLQFSAQITGLQTSVSIALTGLTTGHTYNPFVFVPTLPYGPNPTTSFTP